jgi:hypothetical protein
MIEHPHDNSTKWRHAVLLVAGISAEPLAANDPAPETPPQIKFDILLKQPRPPVCKQGNSDEIVVCAAQLQDPEQFRLRPLKDGQKFKEVPIKAEMAISENATLVAEADSADIGAGGVSKRLMVRLKIKF